jgi:cytochrome oxidase assembly protein ShyY1
MAQSTSAVALSSVLSPGEPLSQEQQYTTVTATGQYDPQSVLIRNRPRDEIPGLWVVTPLLVADGSQILVLRGWIEATRDNAQQATAPPPPSGPVTVTGVLQPTEAKRGAGLLSNGEATSLNTGTLCPQDTCYEPFVQLMTSQPADSVDPLPVQGPGLGPHLGYAGQWVIFMLLLPVGYVILLRREVQESREPADALSATG